MTTNKNKLDLPDAILQGLMLALLMIGGHQVYVIGKTEGYRMGFFKSYWIFMLVFVLIIIYQIRKSKKIQKENQNQGNKEKGRKTPSGKGK